MNPAKPIKLDKKFEGEIRKVKDGTIVPEDQYVVFLAKDNAFAAALPVYYEFCKAMGCDEAQLQLVELMIHNVNNWRAVNHALCKKPDAQGEVTLP